MHGHTRHQVRAGSLLASPVPIWLASSTSAADTTTHAMPHLLLALPRQRPSLSDCHKLGYNNTISPTTQALP